MKNIKIVCDQNSSEQIKLANAIKKALTDCDTEVKGISSPGEMSAYTKEINPENCQVFVDIDLTGYENETTGGIASINRLPMNIVNILTGRAEVYEEFLNKNQSYMSCFIFMDQEETGKAKQMYPHLWHIECPGDADAIAEYINDLELRYHSECMTVIR